MHIGGVIRAGLGAVALRRGEYVQFRQPPGVVQDHRAMKRRVKIGLQTDALVEVIDPELRDGDQVVTVGNRELADEMQVKVLR